MRPAFAALLPVRLGPAVVGAVSGARSADESVLPPHGPLFRPGAIDLLFQHSRGVMRRLNHLATGALLAAARASRKHVDAADVQAAVFDDEHA